MNKKIISAINVMLFIVVGTLAAFHPGNLTQKDLEKAWKTEFHRDWKNIDLSDETLWNATVDFMTKYPDFEFGGLAASDFQYAGPYNSRGEFMPNSWTMDETLAQPGTSRNWSNIEQFEQDIKDMSDAGFTHLRFSIDWAKVQPEKDRFDMQEIGHYRNMLEICHKYNIKPTLCLLHHTWPQWFDALNGISENADEHLKKQQLGAFARKENIEHFVTYFTTVYEQLHDVCDTWMTMNEPVGYAMQAYYRGKYPPKKKDLKLCGEVVRNMLFAHVEAYHAAKQINDKPQIGFPKVFDFLDPNGSFNPLEHYATNFANWLLIDTILDFFKTGKFVWKTLTGDKIEDFHPQASTSLDFLGVNYYTRRIIKCKWWVKPEPQTARSNETVIGERALHAEGLYRALCKAATVTVPLGIPIVVSESGINDPSDEYRNEHFKRNFYEIMRAKEDGIPVEGYYTWTWLDAFSWSKEGNSKMGLCSVDPETQERHLKKGAQWYSNALLAVAEKRRLYNVLAGK